MKSITCLPLLMPPAMLDALAEDGERVDALTHLRRTERS